MKKSLQKILAVILSLTMIMSLGLVIASAEGEDPTPAGSQTTEEPDKDDGGNTVKDGLNFFERIINFFYDFFNFLHEQYLKFIIGPDDRDEYDWLFNGDQFYFPEIFE